jgi:hypothetical protein
VFVIERHIATLFRLFVLSMLSVALRAAFVALLSAVIVKSDEAVYVDDALNSGWQNWGWNTTVNWAATDLKVGKSSISAVSGAWAGLSLKSPNVISTYAALKFDIAADPNALRLYFEGSGDGAQSSSILFSSISTSIHPTSFTTVIIDFRALPPNGSPLGPGAWDRINFQATGNGASVTTPLFTYTYFLTTNSLVSPRQYPTSHCKPLTPRLDRETN